MRIRFYVQRPSGYMSPYNLKDAMRDGRVARRLRGARDPIYIEVIFKLPVRGPIRPRKSEEMKWS